MRRGGQGKGKRGTRTVKNSHRFDGFGGAEIGRIGSLVVHVRKDLAVFGRGTDLRVDERDGEVGSEAFQTVQSCTRKYCWSKLSE